MTTRKIWFILGFSGAGKTHFCRYVTDRHDWLHFQIDFWKPGIQDGLDCYGLREAWNSYEKEGNGATLIGKIVERFSSRSRAGGIFDFPSSRILTYDQIQQIKDAIKVVYFVADPDFCIAALMERERQTGGNLDEAHWHQHNDQLVSALNDPLLKPYCIRGTNKDSSRKREDELYAEVLSLDR